MNKKVLQITLLALSLVFTACGGSKEDTVSQSNGVKEVASLPGEYPIVDEKITLKVFLPSDPFINDLTTNELTKEYEEKTNVKIEWEEVPKMSLKEKLNLILSTNQSMPDIFLNTSLSNAQITNYGSNLGMFRDLTPYIEKYGPNIQKMLDYDPSIRQAVTAQDGKIYALPSVEEAYHVRAPQKLWVYKPWLEELGLEVPQTTDEFYEMLKIFKEKKGDIIPLTGAITGWYTGVLDFFMCSFIYSDQDNRWIVENGEVSVPFDKDQWREGLKYLNKLYVEGLLDEGAFTQDQAQLRQLTMSGKVGVATAGASAAFAQGSKRTEYITIPPLEGPNGNRVTAYEPMVITLGKFAVPTASEHPDVAVRWLDYFLSEEGSLRSRNGVEGKDWRRAEDGEISISGNQAKYLKILKFNKNQNSHWMKIVPQFFPGDLRNAEVDESVKNGKVSIEKMLYDETAKNYDPYLKKEVMKEVYMDLDSSMEYSELDYIINSYVEEMAAKFVLGQIDINSDKEWKNYLKVLKGMNLDRYVDLKAKAYKKQYVN
ncbi:extracellular solute-binding protein (plasmid) [Fusobacteria bacterium ZRK30]|nr:extracellular solute-binding protein [Fusobacteria bacterium ZRK30]